MLDLSKAPSGYMDVVVTSHSAGLEGRRRFIKWVVATTSMYPDECFGKVKHLEDERIFYLRAADEG